MCKVIRNFLKEILNSLTINFAPGTFNKVFFMYPSPLIS